MTPERRETIVLRERDDRFWKEMQARADKLRDWLEIMYESYAAIVSRPEETPSKSGFDSEPTHRPCEHRGQWYRGRLCLACDNTGWRRATAEERAAGLALDPYASRVAAGVTIAKDESAAATRARARARTDAILVGLHQTARVRAGVEMAEDRELRTLRVVGNKPRTVSRIMRGLELLRDRDIERYDLLPREPGLLALSVVMYVYVRGAIDAPPTFALVWPAEGESSPVLQLPRGVRRTSSNGTAPERAALFGVLAETG